MKHKISGLIVYVFYCFFFFGKPKKKKKKTALRMHSRLSFHLHSIVSTLAFFFFFASLSVYVYEKRIIMAIKEKCVSVWKWWKAVLIEAEEEKEEKWFMVMCLRLATLCRHSARPSLFDNNKKKREESGCFCSFFFFSLSFSFLAVVLLPCRLLVFDRSVFSMNHHLSSSFPLTSPLLFFFFFFSRLTTNTLFLLDGWFNETKANGTKYTHH